MGTSEATQGAGSGTGDGQNQNQSASANANAGQGAGEQTSDSQTTQNDRPKFSWDAEQQAEINRIVARETRSAVDKALRDKQKEAADAEAEQRGEHQRLLTEARSENKQLKTQVGQLQARSAVRDVAAKAKANEPEAIYDMVAARLEFDGDLKPTNVSDLVDDVKKRYPGLFGQSPPGRAGDGGNRGNPPGKTDMNAMIRAAAGYGSQ
jgi:hypothetical protein